MVTAQRYCPACGSARVSPRLVHHWRCQACGVTDWKNPQPVAGTFILREGRVLLVRRALDMEFGPGGWVFPGGFVERGETPWQGAIRETWEEAGVRPIILRALPPQTVLSPHNIVMPFLAALPPGEEPTPGPESAEVAWFTFDEIPWDEIPFSTTTAALRSLIAGERGSEVYREVSTPGRSRTPLRFCAHCGSPLPAPGRDGAVRCSACLAVRWANPSPCAGFLAIRDRLILLGRRREGRDGAGRWALPSGHMEPGETPADTAARELAEETGIEGVPERFVGLFASGDHSEAVYTGAVVAEHDAPSGEFAGLEWFTGPEAAALPVHHGTPDLVRWARTTDLLD